MITYLTMERKEIEEKFKGANSPYSFETYMEEFWYQIGCIDGLIAADAEPNYTKLWHPSTELPRDKFIALLSDGEVVCGVLTYDAANDNDYAVFIYGDYVIDWSLVVKWMYVKDLLPKTK